MDYKVKNKMLIFLTLGLFIGMSLFTAVADSKSIADAVQLDASHANKQRVILCTGFWNPTGSMLASFSQDPELNPDGWDGENWEDLGYDIYSYFPQPGEYTGMFEVDYQDTWNDFWNVTNELHPFAIISFGAGNGPWEIEYNARNLDVWINDEKSPYQPTPCPPDDSVAADFIRHSTLPIQQIEDTVNDQTTLRAWVDWNGNPGAYLCEYIAYLGMWYQSMHNASGDPTPCRVAGFIHVNSAVAVAEAMKAAQITIRETIAYLSSVNLPPDAPVITGSENGTTGVEYEYEMSTEDADLDDLFYFVDWGDGTNSGWMGSYASGQEVSAKHVWAEDGSYLVKVKAKDVFDAESDWTTLEVTMPTSLDKPFLCIWEKLFERFPCILLLKRLMNI